MQNERLDFCAILPRVLAQFGQFPRCEAAVAEHPLERRANGHGLAPAFGPCVIPVLHRSYFERGAEDFDWRLQLSREIEWFRACSHFVKDLQLLKRSVCPPDKFFGAALNVITEHALGTKQWRQGREVFFELLSQNIRHRPCDSSQSKHALGAVICHHLETSRIPAWRRTSATPQGSNKSRLSADQPLVNLRGRRALTFTECI